MTALPLTLQASCRGKARTPPRGNGERERFEFVRQRDGHEEAVRFMRENVLDTYRIAVLGIRRTGKYAMYRRQLIQSYCDAKAILAAESGVRE